MSFKDNVAADLGVFLNTDEFAEVCVVDGLPMACVIDRDTGGQFTGVGDGALYATAMTLYAKTADLATLAQGMPKPDRTLTIDDQKYLVLDVADDDGLTAVTLQLVAS